MIKVYIEKNPVFFPEVKYIWNLFCSNKKINYLESDNVEDAEFKIGISEDSHLKVQIDLYASLIEKKPSVDLFERNGGYILLQDGTKDLLATAFFMVSCAQELGSLIRDEYDRFPYKESYQYRMKNYQKNLVQDCFDALLNSFEILRIQSAVQILPSQVFISHDIDTVYGSLLQDTFYTVKDLNFRGFFKCIFSNILQKAQWLNIDRILKIEENAKVNSTFFWLPVKGQSEFDVMNADYDIQSSIIKDEINLVTKKGGTNGIHKSISKFTFEEEIKQFEHNVIVNRYHFLAFNPHSDFIKIEEAGIQVDSSLAYAESFGFRNNYALPYHPYLFTERRAANFIECPLNVMDTTFFNYKKMKAADAYKTICNFIDQNKSNAIISLLWHNNFISDYKYRDYYRTYLDLLNYLNENNLNSIDPENIIKKFK
ncbi:hypothetical protein BH11BAC2_BH11BAC2_16670 [soil metagenome]